ncbi:peptidase [Fervidicella metallireducens AeB]|uniref:Peptidase n=1 Tax=Fervidicella metallireducens AeB TaxID=1403537 RepID=A0A017RYC6_9CLOT|nr:stage II sporulation protein R [Fervidicella metallireducens]EYE89788.1 peptidase [Fervidicella metallireducens AeB]
MKKLFFSIITILLICGIVFTTNKSTVQDDISHKLIRFHVVANSDLDTDQATKLKVRDEILKKIGPDLAESKSLNESLNILNKNLNEIKSIADDVLKREGKDYTATAAIGRFNFPIKKYGEITLPAGEYTALKVVLGKGEGKNWWCVMFPPLCFIDITKGLTTEKTDIELKKVLDESEIESITAFKQYENQKQLNKTVKASKIQENKAKSSEHMKVELRFKSLEMIKKAYQSLKNIKVEI